MNLWKLLKETGIPDHLTCFLRKLYAGQETTVRNGHGTRDWFKIGKEYIKTVCCHPANLTYMQSTSQEMPDCMKHKLESRLPGEIWTTLGMQIYHPNGRKWRGTKECLDEGERGEWKPGLMANREVNNGNRDFILLGSKITADGDCSHEI